MINYCFQKMNLSEAKIIILPSRNLVFGKMKNSIIEYWSNFNVWIKNSSGVMTRITHIDCGLQLGHIKIWNVLRVPAIGPHILVTYLLVTLNIVDWFTDIIMVAIPH